MPKLCSHLRLPPIVVEGPARRPAGARVFRWLLAAAVIPVVPSSVHAQRPSDTPVALVNASVVDVEAGKVTSGQTIVIRDGRIAAVSSVSAARIPVGSRIVNLDGAYVVPGLWDMHVHRAAGVWFDSLAGQPEARAAAVTYFRTFFIASGVTGIRDMGGDLALMRAADSSAETHDLPRPRVLVTGGRIGERRAVPAAPHPVTTEADVRLAVEALRAAGATHVKLAPALAPPLIKAALASCRRVGVPCVGHAPMGMAVRDASAQGLRSVEHLFFLPDNTSWLAPERIAAWRKESATPSLAQRVLYKLRLRRRPADITDTLIATHQGARGIALFRELAGNHTWITPTLTLADGLTRLGRRDSVARDPRYLIEPLPFALTEEPRSPEARTRSVHMDELQHRLVREMRTAGAGILAGTDTPVHAVPGASLHGELALLTRAGLTAAEALRSATLEPARYLQATDSLGTVRAGHVADLVVLRRDPLVDVRNTRSIEIVVTRGRVLRRADLDRLLEEGVRALQEVHAALEGTHLGSNGLKRN